MKPLKIYILSLLILNALAYKAQDDVIIAPASFNTDQREYSPAFYKGGLVYCGDNLTNEALTYIEEKSGNQLSDLYFIALDDSTAKPSVFSKNLKTSFHDGPVCFTEDENTIYFTRSQLVERKLKNRTERFNKFGIYIASYNGEQWGNITSCNFNSPDYNVGHPTLSPNGTRLYVVSDKPGGFGGSDIYYAEIKEGFIGELVNAGPSINTKDNETFPRFDSNGKLYFASNRQGGNGGLDIYKTWKIGEEWTKPVALDTSINSAFDDFGLVYNNDQTIGYFCSNRNGSDDIFKIELNYPEFTNCVPYIKELLCYEFYEEATLNADSVAMIYEWDFGDGHSERSLETYHCYEQAGIYEVKLNIMDPMVGKTFVNEATYELEIEELNQPNISCPDTISVNQGFKLQVNQGNWKDFVVENFYVDYGDSSAVVKNPTDYHLYKGAGVRSIRVLITGYAVGSNERQTNCFVKAMFVKENDSQIAETTFIDQLSYSGFNADKIESFDEAFYSLQILASDSSVLENKDVLKSYYGKVTEVHDPEKRKYYYIVGKAQGPFEFIQLFRTAHKAGFGNAVVKAFEEGKVLVSDMGMSYNETSGEVNFVLENIRFKYDGSKLDENSTKELDNLVTYLKANPNVRIEVGAHTDGSRRVEKAKEIFKKRGVPYSKEAHDKMSSSYNLRLSQQRANNVVAYLKKKGIATSRLKAKGYGELKPIAPNQNDDGSDNLEGQALNRRVEFTILQ